MRATTLLKPGKFSNSERLRRDVAVAIGNVEVAVAHGATGQGVELSRFLADAAGKVPGGAGVTLPANQAIVTSGVALPVAATGTGTTVTITVAGGVITTVALS